MTEEYISPDGKYRWDGQQWVPNVEGLPHVPPSTASVKGVRTRWVVLSLIFCFPLGFVLIFFGRWTDKTKLIVAGVIGVLVVLGGISSAMTPTPNSAFTTSATPKASPSPTLTAEQQAAIDKAAADAKAATDAQAAANKAAADKATADKAAADKAAADKAAADKAAALHPAPIVLAGSGSKVLPADLPEGIYRAAWTAHGGQDNFQVTMHNSGQTEGIVNEIPPSPSSGDAYYYSSGGHRTVEVAASTLTWKISFQRIVWPDDPNPKPKPSTMTFNGQGSKVTDAIYIPSGSYKLAWSAQGQSTNFQVTLHWGGGERSGLVNEIPPNPSSGETVLDSGGAWHTFEVAASTLTWTVTLTPV